MDIVNILLFCLMSVVIGAVLMLLVQYYAFIRYFNFPEESHEQKSVNEKYSLPDDILASIKSSNPESKYPIVVLNLIMQFLFHELKNSNKVRKWFYRKLSLELDELITKTTTGKLFDKLTIRDLDLGGQFPEIKNLRVHNSELHNTEGHLENLDLLLDLQYKGNFRLSIDADMVLGKKGSLTLKVKHLSGLARLQFTRKPYTHWSLSFLGDPQLDLGIESQFQGRQMQSNVTSLILNQIRKAVRRKHTLPNYKLRYKPFFHKTEEENDTEIIPNGKLDIKVSELSRLMIPKHITDIYCTLSLGSLPWVEARQRDDRNVIISIDVEIHKAKNQQIGIVFKQEDNSVQIEAVLPNTPAVKANLRMGDILISIEGKRVNTINQVAKIIKGLNRPILTLRIERISPGIIRNDAILEDLELYEDLGDMSISFTKSTDSVQLSRSSTKTVRSMSSTDKGTSSESSSVANTPTNSPRKNQLPGRNSITKASSKENGDSAFDDSSIGTSSRPNSAGSRPASSTKSHKSDEVEHFQQHSTIDCPVDSFIRMEDWCTFKLNDKSNYLNVCVYGKYGGDSELLGYINIPVNIILAECTDTSLGHLLKNYSLMPPTTPELQNHPLSMQSGFDPNLCFGDVLFSFVWTGNSTLSPPNEIAKKPRQLRNSTDKLEEIDKNDGINTKLHNFIRTHFHRSTQCDFCGKKIWLKDAVQCRDCSMCCHKKCVAKCQNSTVCGPVDCTGSTPTHANCRPEFTVTEANVDGNGDDGDDTRGNIDGQRHTFGDLLAQGLKRVNSANNLAIPGVISSLSQSSRSLPPSPQHTPRKQSLVNQNVNPFIVVTQRLEAIPSDANELTKEQIFSISEPLIGASSAEELMSLAKSSSKSLYAELEPNERVNQINGLLSKLRIALDRETASHATLSTSIETPTKTTNLSLEPLQPPKTDALRTTPETNIFLQTKPPSSTDPDANRQSEQHADQAKKAILIGQSEERVQALSVIMLYLCTGLQHAQGVASQ